MSLSGIRDMSVLEEAPIDRQPIQTFVMEENEEIVREALNRKYQGEARYTMSITGLMTYRKRQQSFRSLSLRQILLMRMDRCLKEALKKNNVRLCIREIDVLVSTTIMKRDLTYQTSIQLIVDNADTFDFRVFIS